MSERKLNQVCIYFAYSQEVSSKGVNMFDEVVKPALDLLSYQYQEVEIIPTVHYKPSEIMAYLLVADTAVIDFTHYSPILSFIAGISHAQGKRVISISQHEDTLITTLQISPIIYRKDDETSAQECQHRMIEALQSTPINHDGHQVRSIENLVEIQSLEEQLAVIELQRAQLISDYHTYREPETLDALVASHTEMKRLKSRLNDLQNAR